MKAYCNTGAKKYTPYGDKSQLAGQQEEVSKLLIKIAELEEENYNFKKASAFFANIISKELRLLSVNG